jgi:hypothetical protein
LIFVCFIRVRDHVCVLGVLIFVCFIRGRDHVCVLGVLIFVCLYDFLMDLRTVQAMFLFLFFFLM